MTQALARHDAVLRGVVESNGGQVVKTTGDGLFAAFGSAQDAIADAVAGQVALRSSLPLFQIRGVARALRPPTRLRPTGWR
jgi:class 3 adenylate cyclase